jgi:hypothetical protein
MKWYTEQLRVIGDKHIHIIIVSDMHIQLQVDRLHPSRRSIFQAGLLIRCMRALACPFQPQLTKCKPIPGKNLPEPTLILHAIAPEPDTFAFSHQEHLVAVGMGLWGRCVGCVAVSTTGQVQQCRKAKRLMRLMPYASRWMQATGTSASAVRLAHL